MKQQAREKLLDSKVVKIDHLALIFDRFGEIRENH